MESLGIRCIYEDFLKWGYPQNHPSHGWLDDHFSIENHGDLGIPPFWENPKKMFIFACQAETTSSKRPSLSAIRCTLPTLSGGAAKFASEKGVYPNTWPWKTLKNWGNWCFNPMELGVPFFSNKPSCFFPFVWQIAWFPAELSLDRSTGCQHVDDFELPASALSFSKGDCGSSCNGVATLGNWTNELSPTNSAGCFDYMGSEKMIAASKMT